MNARDQTIVAHVITRLDVGGAQETAIRICAGLDRRRWSPVLVTGDDPGSGGSLRDHAERSGIPVRTVPSLRGPVRPLDDARAVRDLASFLGQISAGIVHTHSSKAGVIGRLAARRSGIAAVVHTVHGWSFNDTQPALVAATYQGIERFMAKRSNALVVVSRTDLEIGVAARIGRPEQYHLIRSGIPLKSPAKLDRTAIRSEFGWGDGDVIVVSVGRLEPQKDPVGLVDAFASAHARDPRLRLALVGDGGLRESASNNARCRGILDRVDLLGLRYDVADLLAAADVFALASRWEGLPRAVLEATRAGIPVVTTDVGGVREIIEDGVSGRVVPVGDPAAFAAALIETVADPTRARRWAVTAATRLAEFSEERMVADTAALYEDLQTAADPRPLRMTL